MAAEYRYLLGEKVVFTNEAGEKVRGVVTELRYPHGKEPPRYRCRDRRSRVAQRPGKLCSALVSRRGINWKAGILRDAARLRDREVPFLKKRKETILCCLTGQGFVWYNGVAGFSYIPAPWI